MDFALILAAICFLFQAERAVLDTYTLFRVLRSKTQRIAPRTEIGPKKPLLILIPALQEQEIILQTIQTMHAVFGKQGRIVIITTAQEALLAKKNGLKKPSTHDVVLQALSDGILKGMRDSVDVMHSPNPHGRMAHQINFALRRLVQKYPDAHFILYNADSIPSKQSVNEFQKIFRTHPEAVVQQPCAFIRDANKDASPFINALALFQTLFCIGHETGLIRRYTPRLRNKRDQKLVEFFGSSTIIVAASPAFRSRTIWRYGSARRYGSPVRWPSRIGSLS